MMKSWKDIIKHSLRTQEKFADQFVFQTTLHPKLMPSISLTYIGQGLPESGIAVVDDFLNMSVPSLIGVMLKIEGFE